MGLVEAPTLPEYWNEDGFFGRDFVRASSLNRACFMIILTASHLCEFELDRQNELKKARKEPYDPRFKVKPFMNDLQLACKAYFVHGRSISIDEGKVAFKGRIGRKQYIKGKPPK